jgi:kynurenine formamidase
MQTRSFIIAYSLVLAILLFADRRPNHSQQDRYSHIVDLTETPNSSPGSDSGTTFTRTRFIGTTIIAPGALIPGTWTAGQIPAERLVAPLVVIDLNASPAGTHQISIDDIASWETQHGMIPQGAVVAIRRQNVANRDAGSADASLPIASDAAQFLIDARYTIGFAVETPVSFTSDRTLAQQLALHGSYVLARTARFTALPATGSLIIVAPAVAPSKDKKTGDSPVRVLAMVR